MSSVLEDGATRHPRAADGHHSSIPELPTHVVDRGRLTRALSVEVPLTIVVGPAGTGKTVAVAAWAAGLAAAGRTVAWVAFDQVDLGEPGPWAVIVAALRRSGVRVPSLVSLGDRVAGDRGLPAMLGAHVAAHPAPVVLVLDCDGPVSGELAASLERVVRQAEARLRVVVLSRTDPPFALLRRRLDGSVAEIRGSDLAFRPDELSALLDLAHLRRSPEATTALHERTLGWAAAVRFAVLDADRRGDAEAAIREVSGGAGPIADYLRAEVLDSLPAADRRLLLDCSVVDVLQPGLVEALAGPRSARRLEALAGTIAEPCEPSGSFRLHPLLREMLAGQLAYEDRGRAAALHRRAARWLADEGRPAEAVRHAIDGEAWHDAARYAIDAQLVAGLLEVDASARALDDFGRMPDGAEGPGPSIVRAAVAAAEGDLLETAAHVARARRTPDQRHPWPEADVALDVLDLLVATAQGDAALVLGAAERAQRSAAALDPRSRVVAAVEARRGDALLVLGKLGEAGRAYRAGESRLGRLALVEAVSGQLRTARSLADRAAAASPDAADPCVQIALAWVDTEADERPVAREHVRLAGVVPMTASDPVPGALLAVVDSRLLRAEGDLEGARDALPPVPTGSPWLGDLVLVEHAMLDLAAGRADRALARHASLEDPTTATAARLLWQVRLAEWADDVSSRPAPQAAASLAARVDEWLLEASRRLSVGEVDGARRAVQRALGLAAPERLRRPFREAPADVLWLLQESVARPAVRRPHPTTPPSVDAPGRQLLEPLTQKEREVLGHLAAMLSTDEIAAAMFVSVNTVRTHVRNILRKLSASRRNEAVRRARALNLIPA